MKVTHIAMLLVLSVCGGKALSAATIDDDDAMDAKKDAAFATSVQSGKAIVVMSNLRLGIKYPSTQSIEENNAKRTTARTGTYQTDLSAYIEWANSQDAKQTITSGHTAGFEGMKDPGPLLDMVAGDSNYQVFVVEPGTYDLGAFGYDLPRISPPSANPAPKPKATSLGSIKIQSVVNTEMKVTKEWQAAEYRNSTVWREECVAVHATGGCVEVRNRPRNVQLEVKPAGYYDNLKPVDVPGSRVRADLTRPFASFTVGAGEVILVEGLYAEAANLRFDEKNCKSKAGDTVECALTQVSLKQSPASVDALKKVPFKNNGYPKLAKLLDHMQTRQVDIRAFKSTKDEALHKEFTMSVD